MSNSVGDQMYQWASDLFPFNRSLTGKGVRQTLDYITRILPELEIVEIATGTEIFDWEVPREWSISEGWIADTQGNKLIDYQVNNLHVMGYSTAVDKILTRSELEPYLHSLPDQPNAIPYVTSYYDEKFGFCLTENQRSALGNGPFHVYIDSRLFNGNLNYGELFFPGETKDEVLFSTYICHPSLANNEISGPVVAIALAKFIKGLESRRFSYRFLFSVETVGTISFIHQNLEKLKNNLICGWVLTCLGDDRAYSFIPTKQGDTYTDLISRRVLKDLEKNWIEYSWLERGSDERQYNAPGVDLPVASLMRTKYGEYPEYHTSLDNLDVISPNGLLGGYNMLQAAVNILETNNHWKIQTLCEPQLGKRGLYPNTSTKSSGAHVKNQMNVISYLDGRNSSLDIAEKCDISYTELLLILENLKNANLLQKISKS